ncbi:Glycoprotein 3-alpha-L-fucosyltransferase A [Holothuria leucospilota]|uniref:Fucosyltransferase n=1 Tax=Holothuria leucospilota TaxID=206669 RepID=A0A9Q1H620_HOLLE|nr:Glycoprotein 3-alpha-L-fucosyltransferase A [Holothuria leucospilota]
MVPFKQKSFYKSSRYFELKGIGNKTRIFTKASNNTISRCNPEETIHKSYSYDVAVVSMTRYWYSHSILPRKIYCKNTNTSILIRKATDEDEDNIRRADILIFSNHDFRDSINWTKLRRLRHGRQLWVHTTGESPYVSLSTCPPPPMDMDIHFNVSYTYHPKADISVPYGQFILFSKKQEVDIKSYFNEKTKLIVWVSSHCSTQMWRRSDFAYDLAKYLPLDMYGACGTLDCPFKEYKKCTGIFKSYKFYLAMENSCCGGYITEKFWDALTHLEAIPVVVGAPRKDYERLAPNNSFIHADDFGSLKELAEYILEVSSKKELYDSYFQWRRLGKPQKNPVESRMAFSDYGVCKLTKFVKSSSADSLAAPSFDPYGPNWFGGCYECGDKEWLRNYSKFNINLKMNQQKRWWRVPRNSKRDMALA